MSKSSKSSTQAKSSSSIGSMCPPTARSPSMMTAEPLTDPRAIPTALSNSVNTAIGATPSDLESLRNPGFSDTSAGSGRASSNASTPITAKAPTSPEMIMNDLRRGSLFGRQSKDQQAGQQKEPLTFPPSFTSLTFTSTNPTNLSTASQLSSIDGKPLAMDQKSQKSGMTESTKTAFAMTDNAKSVPRGRSALKSAQRNRPKSPAGQMKDLKKEEAQLKQKDRAGIQDFSKMSKKSKKSKKSIKSTRFGGLTTDGSAKKNSKKSMKSGKSKKGAKAPGDIDFPSPKSSKKSMKSSKSKKAPPTFGQSGVVKKGDGSQKQGQPKNTSVYLPGVMDNNNPPAANKFLNKDAGKSTKSTRKFNEKPLYAFPGAGKCTRSMDQVAPPTPKGAAQDQSHVVYDVAQLSSTKRRVPPRSCYGGRGAPKSLFGKKKMGQSVNKVPEPSVILPSASPATTSLAPPATVNKIVIFGKTADGKNTIQMTIDMQIVAGEALNGSDKPVQVVPQKVVIGGKEFPLDGHSESKRGDAPQ